MRYKEMYTVTEILDNGKLYKCKAICPVKLVSSAETRCEQRILFYEYEYALYKFFIIIIYICGDRHSVRGRHTEKMCVQHGWTDIETFP